MRFWKRLGSKPAGTTSVIKHRTLRHNLLQVSLLLGEKIYVKVMDNIGSAEKRKIAKAHRTRGMDPLNTLTGSGKCHTKFVRLCTSENQLMNSGKT